MNLFFNNIAQITHLSIESKDALAAVMKRQEFPKGYILVKEDTVCNCLFFIESGLSRTYYL
jgi:hypothetical protein